MFYVNKDNKTFVVKKYRKSFFYPMMSFVSSNVIENTKE